MAFLIRGLWIHKKMYAFFRIFFVDFIYREKNREPKNIFLVNIENHFFQNFSLAFYVNDA